MAEEEEDFKSNWVAKLLEMGHLTTQCFLYRGAVALKAPTKRCLCCAVWFTNLISVNATKIGR